jgi:hypothetical protein
VLKFKNVLSKLPHYLVVNFDTHYIIFKNVEILPQKKKFFKYFLNCEKKYWIFKNFLFLKLKIFKINTIIPQTCVENLPRYFR